MLRLKGLAEAAMLPKIVIIGDEQVEVSLFTMDDFIRWGTRVDQSRIEDAVKGASVYERAQLLGFYRVIPSDLQDLKQRIGSPAGTMYVIQTCYRRAKVVGRLVKGDDGKEKLVPLDPAKEFDAPIEVPNSNPTQYEWKKIDALIRANDIDQLKLHAYDLAGINLVNPQQIDQEQEEDEDPLTRPGQRSSKEPVGTGA
jgi:hypothetical protein